MNLTEVHLPAPNRSAKEWSILRAPVSRVVENQPAVSTMNDASSWFDL